MSHDDPLISLICVIAVFILLSVCPTHSLPSEVEEELQSSVLWRHDSLMSVSQGNQII